MNADLPSKPLLTTSIQSRKRAFAQQATAPSPGSSTSPRTKVARLDVPHPSSSFSFSRRNSTPRRSPPATGIYSNGLAPTTSQPSRVPYRVNSQPPRTEAQGLTSRRQQKQKVKEVPNLSGPVHDEAFVTGGFKDAVHLTKLQREAPKSALGNFAVQCTDKAPSYTSVEVQIDGTYYWRTTATVALEPPITGVGDHKEKKGSERLAALSVVCQLHGLGVLNNPRKLKTQVPDQTEVTLSDSSTVDYDSARSFMDYYCHRYDFPKPEITFNEKPGSRGWEALMVVGGHKIGFGTATTKKAAQVACYLDVTQYLESTDRALWEDFERVTKTGNGLRMAPPIYLRMSGGLTEAVNDLNEDMRASSLYHNDTMQKPFLDHKLPSRPVRTTNATFLELKSQRLAESRQSFLSDTRTERLRATIDALPIRHHAQEVVSHIATNEVTVCIAETGSGKTTQVPQLILDDYINRGKGASCNVICTQPRRLAAISVADRVAKERDERVGQSVGYQVRFDASLPENHGSITFCTTGVFLRRLQSALSSSDNHGRNNLDDVTHIVVDEVHERDVDTDLLLVVLKRLLADRRARNVPLKVVLMSATVDPALFQKYFPDDNGQPAKVIQIPGRSFPVTRSFLEDFIHDVVKGPGRWIMQEESVDQYLSSELEPTFASSMGLRPVIARDDDFELPYPLIAKTVAHVVTKTQEGHVLVFLPGWEEIMALQRVLLTPVGPLGIDFNQSSQYTIHLLHSSIPLAEQRVIFDPSPPGVRRIILATNIAETSVTIPDVVCVVDTARMKEKRYDPDRHLSSLASTWVGLSNMNQRVGRAGRHRPGEYYGLFSRKRTEALLSHQTVEMKRVDLSNVVMHIKAMNFQGITTEEVLAEAIEPPESSRVSAAMKNLRMAGALDEHGALTPLGRVLLQLPVDIQMGRLILLGGLFRCLDQSLTLAAIFTNRDPFLSPAQLKNQASTAKASWAPPDFKSDALAMLKAYNAWWALQSERRFAEANRFCNDNFLSKPSLLTMQKLKVQLLQALDRAGVLEILTGEPGNRSRPMTSVPRELDRNGNSLPLLAALISTAAQPKFAIKRGEKTYRTPQDEITFMHPSSVNDPRNTPQGDTTSRQDLYAFMEKRRNLTVNNSQTFLVNTTRLDPLTYLLFGAHSLKTSKVGVDCDGWLPATGNINALDRVHQLRVSINRCLSRVFRAIQPGGKRAVPQVSSQDEEIEFADEEDVGNGSLTFAEIQELDNFAARIVDILESFHEEDKSNAFRGESRAPSPSASFGLRPPLRLSRGGPNAGYTTPPTPLVYNSRPTTPTY